jgi:hypothetical protein
MQMVFAERLKKMTFEFRNRAKEHYGKIQELHGGDTHRYDGDDIEQGRNSAGQFLETDVKF